MRASLVGACVCVVAIFTGSARAAIPRVNNPALQSVVRNAFQSVKDDVRAMSSCRGCTESAQPVYQDTAAGEKALNTLPSFGGATYDAYSNAFKALQYYSRFALAYSDSYISATYGQSSASEFNLAQTYLRQARGFAERADEALALSIVP